MYAPIETHEEDARPQSIRVGRRALTGTAWLSMILFGVFTLGHYLRRAWIAQNADEWKDAWDATDPGLYRPQHTDPNRLMILHFVGGISLMFLGPIQLIPFMRRHYLDWHRILGRIYIGSALLAACGATLFVLLYGTSRDDKIEDYGNILFGSLVILCAAESYRHAAYTKKIERHKLWSWRLFALIFGAVLYRLYVTIYFAFVLFASWEGNAILYESLYFLFYLPNLLVVEVLWRYQDRQGQSDEQRHKAKVTEVSFHVLCILFLSTTTAIIFLYGWLPAILGMESTQSGLSELNG